MARRSLEEQAFIDWGANKAFWRGKTYWITPEDGPGNGRAKKASWSDLIKKKYPNSDSFYKATDEWLDAHGYPERERGQFGYRPRVSWQEHEKLMKKTEDYPRSVTFKRP